MPIKCPYPNHPCFFINKNGNCNHINPQIEQVPIDVEAKTLTTVCFDYTTQKYLCAECGQPTQSQRHLFCKKHWKSNYKWQKQQKL